MLKKLAVVTIRAECTNVDVSSFFPLEDFLNLKGDFVKLKMVNLNKDLIFLLESNCFYWLQIPNPSHGTNEGSWSYCLWPSRAEFQLLPLKI